MPPPFVFLSEEEECQRRLLHQTAEEERSRHSRRLLGTATVRGMSVPHLIFILQRPQSRRKRPQWLLPPRDEQFYRDPGGQGPQGIRTRLLIPDLQAGRRSQGVQQQQQKRRIVLCQVQGLLPVQEMRQGVHCHHTWSLVMTQHAEKKPLFKSSLLLNLFGCKK